MAIGFSTRDAGKVMIRPRGEYSNSTSYEILDSVRYKGKSYVALRSTTGNLPTNEIYWDPLVELPIDETFNTGSRNALENREISFAFSEVRDNFKLLGIKNLIDLLNASSGSTSGITYTANAGIIKLSGTANATAYINVITTYDIYLSAGRYYFSGCPSGGGVNKYYMKLYDANGTFEMHDYGQGFSFIVNSDIRLNLQIIVAQGQSFSNTEFRPMITFSYDDKHGYNDFEPHQRLGVKQVINESTKSSPEAVSVKAVYDYVALMITTAINDSY